MPIVEQSGINWATEIEEKEPEKLVTSVEDIVENNKKYRITKIYKSEIIKVPKTIAERKSWRKFGDCENDPSGIVSSTTLVGDEIQMQFLENNLEVKRAGHFEEIPAPNYIEPKIKDTKITCKFCGGHHWSSHCTSKPTVSQTYPYESTTRKEDDSVICVNNLTTEAKDEDLYDLFGKFGKIQRIYILRDKYTKVPKGKAFVKFSNRKEAERAILAVNNHGYHHLILKVDWAKYEM